MPSTHPFVSPVLCRAFRGLLTLAAALGLMPTALAGVGVGLGAGPDRGHVDCVASFACNRSSGFAKFFGTYSIGEEVEIQAVYFDGGRFKGGDTTPLGTEFGGDFKVSGLGLTAGYRWRVAPSWSMVARGGFAGVRTTFDYVNPVWGRASRSTAQPLFGLGVAYEIAPSWRVGVDLDVTRFKVHTTQGPLQMLGLSTQFSF